MIDDPCYYNNDYRVDTEISDYYILNYFNIWDTNQDTNQPLLLSQIKQKICFFLFLFCYTHNKYLSEVIPKSSYTEKSFNIYQQQQQIK